MTEQKNEKLDRVLREVLETEAAQVRVTSGLKYRIDQSLFKSKKEEYLMKTGMKKRIILATAACLAMGSITAVAAGKLIVASYSSHCNANERAIQQISDVAAVSEEVGFPLKAVESFQNGYALAEGHITDTNANDTDGRVVDTFKEVFINYEKDGNQVTLVERQAKEYAKTDPSKPNQTKIECGDIVLTYGVDQYKFVPPDYEPTEEEKELMEAKELYISYGTDEVIESEYHFMTWEQDGIAYELMCSGEGALGAEELTEMAKELIELD